MAVVDEGTKKPDAGAGKPDAGEEKKEKSQLKQGQASGQKTEGQKTEEESQKQPAHYRVVGSFGAQMVVACTAVAFITAMLTVCFTLAVFDSYFRMYSASNIDAVASYLSAVIGNDLTENGVDYPLDAESLREGLQLSTNAGILITRDGGPFFESWPVDDMGREITDMSVATQMATADVIVDNAFFGSLHLWMTGTETLVGRFDAALRNDTMRAMIIVGILSVLIACLVGIVLSGRLTKPIRMIAVAAQRINRGDLKARSNVIGENEIGRLGESFDAMADSIERDRNLEMRLTSDVAHELRTPLMAIQATIEAMIDGVYDVTPERLEVVDGEVQRLSRLVNALLSLSRLERRSEPMHEKVCNLGSIVEAVFESNEILAREAGLSFDMHIIEDSDILCDSDMIRQAITNLVSNSLRYTSQGSIDLYVRRDNAMAAVDVSDTGIGLDPDEEKMVFSRFWRSEASRSRESGGLGVGLAVVKEIVERHGGRVAVNGKKGFGSTFTIYLPRYIPETELRKAKSRKAPGFNRDSSAEAKDGGEA